MNGGQVPSPDQMVPEIDLTRPALDPVSTERGLVDRLHRYPLLHVTMDQLSRVYHSAHASSGLLRLGASTVEYSYRLLAPQLRTLDNYAGRQLARLESLADDPVSTVLNTGRSFFGYAPPTEGAGPADQSNQDKRHRLEATLQSLQHAEAYINILMVRLRHLASQLHVPFGAGIPSEAEDFLSSLRQSITQEIVNTLRATVELVNREGPLLPLPGQRQVRQFLMSLPTRFGETLVATGASARLLFMANEAVVAIKSLAGIVATHIYPHADDGSHND